MEIKEVPAAVAQILQPIVTRYGLVPMNPLLTAAGELVIFAHRTLRREVMPERKRVYLTSEQLNAMTIECAEALKEAGLLTLSTTTDLDVMRRVIASYINDVGQTPPDAAPLQQGRINWDEVRARCGLAPQPA